MNMGLQASSTMSAYRAESDQVNVPPPTLTGVLDRFRRSRARTRALFDLLDDAAYYTRPIQLRNPVVFYEGHLPAFAVNTLVKRALGRRGIDEHLETIFARGIDPEEESLAIARGNPAWPPRAAVRAYAAAADALLEDVMTRTEPWTADAPAAVREALGTILEHEEMHQETLAYMWHRIPMAWKRKPDAYRTVPPRLTHTAPGTPRVPVPAGAALLGTPVEEAAFSWDNERPAHVVSVPAFEIDVHNITNAAFLEFVDAGGYGEAGWWRPEDFQWVRSEGVLHPSFWVRRDGRWLWRGMFEEVPLPEDWPVYVTWAEAVAFARWRGGRLPTEAEYHRAAFGTEGAHRRRYPWGDTLTGRPPANFDFVRWDPDPVGAHPDGASAFGVHDLVGNGWEWTSTVFGPFDGFEPMPSYPEYSADFFDSDHYVMKGASPVTPRELVRPGFRNWFRPRYPYVYATFRCVWDA
jgi:ergothioneine biosynthesis protein EgtB